jgi:predicted transcriptional regulator
MKEKVDCPPDMVYFVDESQLERSDLSGLSVEEMISAQDSVNGMLELMHKHQVAQLPAPWDLGEVEE